MEKYLEIVEVHGREILDSRGNPTVSATVTAEGALRIIRLMRAQLLISIPAGQGMQ